MSVSSQLHPDRRDALLRTVATWTMRWPFRVWAFGEAVALGGLLAASRTTGAEEPLGFVRALLRTYVGRGVGRSAEEHVAPGAELLALHALDGDATWLDAARALARLHLATPPGPDGVRYLRPDLPGWRRQIWVDSMDGGPPFLARLAHVTGDDTYAHEATTTLLAYARLLQDERSGLFVHGFEETCGRNGQLWARGNGWAAMGLVETLAWVPREAPMAGELRQRLAALLDGLAVLQQSSGLWPTVLDRPESPLETTLAVMTTTAIDRARQAGVLQGNPYESMRERAQAAVLEQVSASGALGLVSDATPIGELRMYVTRPFGVFPWGQGPLLLMLAGPTSSSSEPEQTR